MKIRVALALSLVVLAVSGVWSKEEKKAEVGTVIGIDLGTTYSW